MQKPVLVILKTSLLEQAEKEKEGQNWLIQVHPENGYCNVESGSGLPIR